MEITYEEAKEAKEILLKYLESSANDYEEITHNFAEKLAYLALSQDYFLS